MKIGILTYHRAENYGAMLQAYALKTYLQALGHDVSFVDYWPKYHSDYFRLFPWQQLKGRNLFSRIGYVVKLVFWVIPRYMRKRRFQKFMHARLHISSEIKYVSEDTTEQYDVVVYGSDQIWRKQNLGGVGFDGWYFGTENVCASKKVAYAGSMGTLQLTDDDTDYIKQMMKNFHSLSVREKDLQLLLSNLNISAALVIDPVFMLSKSHWEELSNNSHVKKGKYILYYHLLDTPESTCFAEKLSRQSGLPIREVTKIMSFKHIGSRYIYSASVEDFLSLIREAEYVVSNSFHGVAMSIIFEKQFFAVGMGNRANRVLSLLESLDIRDRYHESCDTITGQPIDYVKVGERLQMLKRYSKDYLTNSISMVKSK